MTLMTTLIGQLLLQRIEPCGLCNSEADTCANNHHNLLLEILLIARNVLIINTNWDDKITKETNWKQHNRETPK